MVSEVALADLSLRTGEQITIMELHLRPTYGNLLAGTPQREYNERLLHRLAEDPMAWWHDPTPALVMRPAPSEIGSQMPRYAITVQLDCAAPLETGNDGSRLRLVLLIDRLPKDLPRYLKRRLRYLDWKSHARDYQF